MLETRSGRLVGPLEVISPLFFNRDSIWDEPDPYNYRIKLGQINNVWEADITSLWSILLEREKSNFYTFTTIQRSNNTLLPNEGKMLSEKLEKNGLKISPQLSSDIEAENLDILKNDKKKFSSEARLETALLLNKNTLIDVLIKEDVIRNDSNYFTGVLRFTKRLYVLFL